MTRTLGVAWGRPYPPTLAEVADRRTIDEVFRALDNEIRRGILGVLHDSGGTMRSTDIASPLRDICTWQTISRHLRVLTESGILDCRMVPNGRAYSINGARLRSVAGLWIARVATPGTWTEDRTLVHDFDE